MSARTTAQLDAARGGGGGGGGGAALAGAVHEDLELAGLLGEVQCVVDAGEGNAGGDESRQQRANRRVVLQRLERLGKGPATAAENAELLDHDAGLGLVESLQLRLGVPGSTRGTRGLADEGAQRANQTCGIVETAVSTSDLHDYIKGVFESFELSGAGGHLGDGLWEQLHFGRMAPNDGNPPLGALFVRADERGSDEKSETSITQHSDVDRGFSHEALLHDAKRSS
mmetsp:Transcript_2311/g.4435  ORF Transcript_2311/g.4435 Transcript_2311/m.4435 type:complete len:227 (+) Transcript_2311:577-1257(+)